MSADEAVRIFGCKVSCMNLRFVKYGSADVSSAFIDGNLALTKEEFANGKEFSTAKGSMLVLEYA